MRALTYLTWRSFVNNIKKALKRPVTLVLIIFFAAYAVFVSLSLGRVIIELRFDSVQGLVVLVSVWTIYIFLCNLFGYSSRKGVLFRPGHTHFVFPAPISPKLILVHAAWMNYLLSVAVNLLFILAGLTVFGVCPWKMLLFFLAGVLELTLEISIMVCLYTNETLPEWGIRAAGYLIKAFLAGVTLFLVLYFRREGLTLESASAFFDWPGLQMIPVIGWNIAVYRLILLGTTRLNMICSALYLCTVAGMFLLARHMKCEGAYFEDAAKFADDYAEMRRKKKNGEMVFGMEGKKKRIRHVSGDFRASGAKAIFYRQLLEYKKERFFIFSKITGMSLAVGLLLAFALRKNVAHSGMPQVFLLGIIAYMTLCMSGYLGKWESELKNPYLFLLPDTAFRKLWYSTLLEHGKALVDGCCLCIPIGIAWKISPVLLVQGILIYTVLQADKMYTKVIVQCLLGDLLGKSLQEVVRLLFQMFFLGFGVAAAVIIGLLADPDMIYPVTLVYSIIVTGLMGALAAIRFDSMEQLG